MLHEARVGAIAFSPDGKLLTSGSDDGTVRLWDTSTGRQLGRAMRHPSKVRSVTFSPDGRFVAAGSADMRVWEIHYEAFPEQLKPRDEVLFVPVVSPDGSLMATVNAEEDVELQETATGKARGNPFCKPGARSLAFSPDNKLLVIGTAGWTAEIWDIATARKLQSFKCSERVYGIAFSPDGNLLAAAHFDGNVSLWNLVTGHPLGLPLKHPGPVREVAFGPDGNLLAAAYGSDPSQLQVKVWDITMDPPCLGIVLPFRIRKDAGALDSFSLTGKVYIGANGDEGEVAWQLHELPQDINDMRLRTWAALCLRHNFAGPPTAIPADEWHELREQLDSRVQTGIPSRQNTISAN
jgi:WD40 repeat protein